MKQGVYNAQYHERYDSEALRPCYQRCAEFYSKYILFPNKEELKFLEIGAINTYVLDLFAQKGFKTSGLDIHDHPLKAHDLIVCDIEKFEPKEKFDVIWASHVFEHLKDPIAVVKKCNEILNEDGYIYIGMPDPYFLDLNQPEKFGHWHIFEHHIMWEMESFCEVLRENGFEIIFKHHNTGTDFICTLDFGIVAKKRIDVSNYSGS